MANFGAKPTGISSPADGFNASLRRAVARRDPHTMRMLEQNYDREVVEEIAALCDKTASARSARERLRTIEAAIDEYDRLTEAMNRSTFAIPSPGRIAQLRDLICRAKLDVEVLLEDTP